MLLPEEQEHPLFTWALLKEFCNHLTKEQLQQEVIVPQEEGSIKILYASDLGEDQYHFTDTCTADDYDPETMEGMTFKEAIEKEDYILIPGHNV